MKLFCDGEDFPAQISPYTGTVPSNWGDGEITVFLAKSGTAFSREAKWEIENGGKRVELALRVDSPLDYSPPAGTYAALFTAPAVG